MKVTFDSNVWRIVCTPDKFPKDPCINSFKKIREAIINKKLDPYISETVFTIEAIKRKERKNIIGSKKPVIKTTIKDDQNGFLGMTFAMSPERGINFNDNKILKQHFDDAIKLGFKIVRLPRISGFINEEVEKMRYIQEGDQLTRYLERAFEALRKIEENKAGIAHIKKIGYKYNSHFWVDGIKNSSDDDKNSIAKAAAEWADGDSVAVCIGLQCDFFCTRDCALSAGSDSVLSQSNLSWLQRDFNFKTILPENLAKCVS